MGGDPCAPSSFVATLKVRTTCRPSPVSIPPPLPSPGSPPPPPPSASPAATPPPPVATEKGLGESRGSFVDWIATNTPSLGGLCPAEGILAIALVFIVAVFLVADLGSGKPVYVFLEDISIPMAALATAGAALETWRNLRQIERTDEGAATPHLWILGSVQNRVVAGSQMTSSVTGLHELFVHNYGPGLALDVRVLVDGKPIDRVPYLAALRSAQIGGALHGHALDGTHTLEVLYLAPSGREHRLAGTLFRDRDLGEILFRSDKFNHIFSVA